MPIISIPYRFRYHDKTFHSTGISKISAKLINLACEQRVHVGHRPVHGAEGNLTHCKIRENRPHYHISRMVYKELYACKSTIYAPHVDPM